VPEAHISSEWFTMSVIGIRVVIPKPTSTISGRTIDRIPFRFPFLTDRETKRLILASIAIKKTYTDLGFGNWWGVHLLPEKNVSGQK
jgi:hypothetical protein